MLFQPDEIVLLQRGEIGRELVVGGVVANTLVGFGLGQAIQGRWTDGGWKFTAGMAGGIVLFFATADAEGQSVGLELVGAVPLATFYVWGIVDAATGAHRHNARVRELKRRHGLPLALPYVRTHAGTSTAGLVLRF